MHILIVIINFHMESNISTSDDNSRPTRRRFEVRPGRENIQVNIRHAPHPNQRFQPLPQPTGNSPFHLKLEDILSQDEIQNILQSNGISFHIVGDTGGVKHPEPQQIVSIAMENDYSESNTGDSSSSSLSSSSSSSSIPSFFYHLGDVVYYWGESKEYFGQFYDPYRYYPGPIFAIPGNHDGDITPTTNPAPSLEAFVNNFCAKEPIVTPDAGEVNRSAMTQPNVYWTLDGPFITIIGLYSNVPEGGQLEDSQIEWFIEELKAAPKDKALIVAVHHPPYSADNFHSGGKYMEDLLDNAFNKSGRFADIVFSGHVHNYQRFTRIIDGNREIPYIVAGAGGYWNLTYMQKSPDGEKIGVPYDMPIEGLTLENYCDDRHGYMMLRVTANEIIGDYYAVSRPQESWRAQPQRIDTFRLDWNKHTITKSMIMP